jgi:hypothetical protein
MASRLGMIALLFLISVGTFANEPEGGLACVKEIQRTDRLANQMGGDSVIAQAAQSVVGICQTIMTAREMNEFDSLKERCLQRYQEGNSGGTAIQAMAAICQMNAVRFVMSLQLDLNSN